METLEFIKQKYNITDQKSPIELPGGRREKGLALLLKELNFDCGAEIGVAKGEYSEILCKINPSLLLFSIDAWSIYPGYRDYKNQKELDEFYEKTKERMSNYNCKIIRGWSMDVVKDFPDEKLDFVFIDGGHDF